jgi:hypothetical protein
METLTAALQAVAAFFGWKREADTRRNTPAMQANAQAKRDAELADRAAKDVEPGNLDQLRKDASE